MVTRPSNKLTSNVLSLWWRALRKPTAVTWFALALVLGNLIHQTQVVTGRHWYLLLGCSLVGLLGARLTRVRWLRIGLVFGLSVSMGGLWTDWRQPQPKSGIGAIIDLQGNQRQLLNARGLIHSIDPEPVSAEPDLFDSFQFSTPVLRFTVTLDSYHDGQQWSDSSGKLLCRLERGNIINRSDSTAQNSATASEAWPTPELLIGQRIELLGLVTLPPPVKNPGQFDRRHHLWINGWHGELSLNHPGQITVLEKVPDWRSTGQRIRHAFKVWLRRHVSDQQYPMAAAVLLGDRGQLDSSIRMQYAATGTVHVLAISGLHLGILAGALLWLTRWSFVPQRLILLATIFVVVSYAWLVEFRPPIVRAAVIVSIMCLATLIGRRAMTFNSLALGLLVVFLIQPWQILASGTQLSFLAVGAIVLFLERRQKRESNPLLELQDAQRSVRQRWLRQIGLHVRDVYVCGAMVFLACLPLVIHHFNLIAWIGLLINPIVVLPMSLALLSGFGVFVFAAWCPPLADVCGWVCSRSLLIMNGTVETAFQWPGSYFWATSPGQTWIVIWYGWWLIVLWLGAGLITRKVVIGGTIAIAVLAYSFPLPKYPDRVQSVGSPVPLTMTFIDVGHGNSVVLRTPSGKVILFDAGSFPSAQNAHQRIGGVLLAHGIRRIDQVVISHADMDHYNGVPELLRRFSIGEVLVPPEILADPSPYVQALAQYIELSRIPLRTVSAGDVLHEEPDLRITVVSPPREPFVDGDNSNSLVLDVSYGDQRALLTADVEGDGLRHLFASVAGPFSVVQVPHHGSRNSQQPQFATWSQPHVAIISGLQPRIPQETVATYQESGGDVYITDRDGAILVQMYPDGKLHTRGYRQQPWPTR